MQTSFCPSGISVVLRLLTWLSTNNGLILKTAYLKYGVVAAGLIALTACGGGGGGGGGGDTGGGGNGGSITAGRVVFLDPTNNNVQVSLAGLDYSTPTISMRETAANGDISYTSGENITLFIGNTQVSIPAKTTITQADIAAGFCTSSADPAACQYNVKKNLEALLLTLDDGRNSSDGIQLLPLTDTLTLSFTSSTDQFQSSLAQQLSASGITLKPLFSSSLGINTEAPQAEQDEVVQAVPFADIFRVARPFRELSSCTDNSQISFDSNGWPTSAPGTTCTIRTILLNNATAETVPAGIYTVLYEGEGTITYGNYAQLVSRDTANKKDTINIQFSGSAVKVSRMDLSISANNPANPIRNIRVIMPGGICEGNPFVRVSGSADCPGTYKSFEASLMGSSRNNNAIVFNPDYLNFMKDFRVIRMMNLMEASPSKSACNGKTGADYTNCLLQDFTWDQRAKLDTATWGGSARIPLLDRYARGAPLEVAVALANQLNAHPWFTIPHNATDDYVTNYANYVRDNLKSGLKAHVEYSNETWNDSFWGALYAREKGKGLYTPSANPFWDGAYYTAKRSVEIFRLWETAFGGRTRLVNILGTYQANKDLSNGMLKYLKDKNDGSLGYIDGLAMGAYFYGCWNRSSHSTCQDTTSVPLVLTEATSIDDVFNIIDNTKSPYGIAALQTQMTQQKTVANTYGKQLFVYEGGQHLIIQWADSTIDDTRKTNLRNLFEAANRDPRMAERYTTMLNNWKTAGGAQFMLYTQPQSFHKYGMFGIKERLLQPRTSAPKYDASLKFQEAQGKCWWNGC